MFKSCLALLPLIFAAPAFAGNFAPVVIEEAPAVAAAPAPTYRWTGGYVGAQLGYGTLRPNGTVNFGSEDDPDTVSVGDALDGEGAIYGLRLGYDRVFGRALVGGLLQYDATDIDLANDTDIDINLDHILRVGLRVGAAMDRNLFYVTGGYASARLKGNGGDATADGYFAGLGYEVFLTGKLTLGAEALYHDFGDFDIDDAIAGDRLDAKASTVSLNLNYRF